MRLAAGLEQASLTSLLALSDQQLETAQLKLSYLGSQTKPIPTVVFTVHGHDVDWDAFSPWLHPNDEIFRQYRHAEPTFMVSVPQMRDAIASLKQVPGEVPQAGSSSEWLSVAVTANDSSAAQGFERWFDPGQAQTLFVYLRQALRADPKDITLMEGQANLEAMRTLQWWGCALGLLPNEIPAKDVSAQVRVVASGLRWNANTKRFESTATLTNTSAQPIRGPIALVVDFSQASVQLLNAHGTTCVTSPVGREFVNIPMPAEALAPGESLEVVLQFERDEATEIRFTMKVLAGPGER